ncbi:hypothetical protein K435DRAFT_973868 [Dendrothele bispora CBS 962.96]|uniref:Uncharacterized protein n=1 Tax=Dendrothele bispora (strain CBS 962.96) TaxID=1314807 RepID=A0A4S8KQN4_DENBC|nr:hypothetical protein K435DRAFT_973868 [Dendrothele bispora CBS 962.96]
MEGITIQEEQRPLRRKVAGVKSRKTRDMAADRSEMEKLEKERKKLEDRVSTWREAQATFMPGCWEHVAKSHASNPENEKLFLPSDFGAGDRVRLGLESLAEEEARLREAHGIDLIARLQYICQIISALNDRKIIHTRGQDQHTKSSKLLKTQQDLRTARLADYNRNRKALDHLGKLDEDYFPFLTVQDTYRKSSELKRRIGDSRATDGRLWTAGARLPTTEEAGPSTKRVLLDRGEDVPPVVGTQSSRRQTNRHAPMVSPRKLKQSKGKGKALEELAEEEAEEPLDEVEDGKLWRVRPKAGFSQEEMDAFMEENRRVQFFRDEAQMERWQEQVEIKHAEFHRAIKYFGRFSDIWTNLAHKSDTQKKPGHAAYARKQAGMYINLKNECETLFKAAATIDETLRDIPEGNTLSDQVLAFRQRERALFSMISSERPPFVDPTETEPPIDEDLGYDTDDDEPEDAKDVGESEVEIESDIGSDEEDDLEIENEELSNESGMLSKRGRDEDDLAGYRHSKRRAVDESGHEESAVGGDMASAGLDDDTLQVHICLCILALGPSSTTPKTEITMERKEEKAPIDREGRKRSVPYNSLFDATSELSFVDSTITLINGDSRNIEGDVTIINHCKCCQSKVCPAVIFLGTHPTSPQNANFDTVLVVDGVVVEGVARLVVKSMLNDTSLSHSNNAGSNILTATLSGAAGLIFGTQRDMLSVWAFWRRKRHPRTVPLNSMPPSLKEGETV